MKNLILSSLILSTILLLSSCYKSTNWLNDNVDSTGKFYPNVLINTLDSATYSANGKVRLYIEYWSKDKMKTVNFYDSVGTAARKLVFSTPYAPAYSSFKKSDTLVYNYTVPASAASGTTIRVDAVIENENGLTKVSNRLSFRVK